jgi:molecular chaperone DnaK
MVEEAKKNEALDRKRKELVEVRNNADSTVYQVEKLLKETGDKVSADMRADIENKVADLRTAMSGEDVSGIRSRTEALTQALTALASAQQQAAAQTPGAQDEPNRQPEGEVVEGDFHDA